jgi:hypothetical protein
MEPEQKNEGTKPKRNRFSTRKLVLVVGITLILIVTLGYVFSINYLTPPSTEPGITFDFDNGAPVLKEGQNLPFNQTSEGIIATFSSPSENLRGLFFFNTTVRNNIHKALPILRELHIR